MVTIPSVRSPEGGDTGIGEHAGVDQLRRWPCHERLERFTVATTSAKYTHHSSRGRKKTMGAGTQYFKVNDEEVLAKKQENGALR